MTFQRLWCYLYRLTESGSIHGRSLMYLLSHTARLFSIAYNHLYTLPRAERDCKFMLPGSAMHARTCIFGHSSICIFCHGRISTQYQIHVLCFSNAHKDLYLWPDAHANRIQSVFQQLVKPTDLGDDCLSRRHRTFPESCDKNCTSPLSLVAYVWS